MKKLKVTKEQLIETMKNLEAFSDRIGFETHFGVMKGHDYSVNDIFEWGRDNGIMKYSSWEIDKKDMKNQIRRMLDKMTKNNEVERTLGIAKLNHRETKTYELC